MAKIADTSALHRALPGRIRPLLSSEMPLLEQHLLRLDPESRHDRFNGFTDESFLRRYAAKCRNDGTIVIAYVEDGKVRAAAELHPPEKVSDDLPEIAFSVESGLRRLGVGTLLFERLIGEARRRGYQKLRITTGSSNEGMRALAHKFGANLSFYRGESTGTIDLTQPELADMGRIPPVGPADLAAAAVSFNQTYWKMLSDIYTTLKPARVA